MFKIPEKEGAKKYCERNWAAETYLLERIAADPAFGVTFDELNGIVKPENYVGRAPRQTEDFIKEAVEPILFAEKEIGTPITMASNGPSREDVIYR